MLATIRAAANRSPALLAREFAGAASLVTLLVAGLYLPGLV